MTDEEERELRIAVMAADLRLKQRQSFWETPKAIALIVAPTAGIMGALGGLVGYRIGSQPPQTINVHLDAPLVLPPR